MLDFYLAARPKPSGFKFMSYLDKNGISSMDRLSAILLIGTLIEKNGYVTAIDMCMGKLTANERVRGLSLIHI